MIKQMTPLQQRLIVSSIGILIVLTAIFLAPVPAFKPIFTLFTAAIIAVAMKEFYRIARVKDLEPADHLGRSLGVLYACAVALSTQYESFHMLPETVLLFSLLACFLYYFVNRASPFVNLSVTVFSLVYLAVPLSCIISIIYFFEPHHEQDGRWWLFYLLAVTKMTDAGGFFVGKKFGRQPLAPIISPKKTWEGALGGLSAAVATSIILTLLLKIFDGMFSLTFLESIFLGVALGIIAQCGDLAESLLKRDGGIKDSSRLPGLGGVLDIVDSLVFTAPLMYIFLKFMYKV